MSTVDLVTRRLHDWSQFSAPESSFEESQDLRDGESSASLKFELKFEIGPPDLCWKRERWLMLADKVLMSSDW